MLSHAELQQQAVSQVRQADRLVSFNWQLETEVATERGKGNLGSVRVELGVGRGGEMVERVVELRGAEFGVFFGNLEKIKRELSELVAGQ
jgi:hypothetical protein